MPLSVKILIFVGAMLGLGLLGFICYKQIEISNRQQAIEAQVVKQKELVDGIVRSQNSYATKDDIEKFIKESGVNLKAIQEDMEKLHAEVSAVNTVLVASRGQHGSNVPSSGTGTTNPNPVDNSDPYDYLTKQQFLDIGEDFSGTKVPIGRIGFSAWQKEPWSFDIAPREYHVVNVLGKDENQRTYVYNKFTVKSGEKKYDVKITKAETQQEYPEATWSWFNPRIYAGADGGVNVNAVKGEFTPSINVGVMSYGVYKNQPDFSVLGVGVGYGTVSKKAQLVITPVTYNVGKHIPLMNNTYVGPSLHVGSGGDVSFMAGIRIGL
jgi:hypothetical protein